MYAMSLVAALAASAPAHAQMMSTVGTVTLTEASLVASVENLASGLMYGKTAGEAITAAEIRVTKKAVEGIVTQYMKAGWKIHDIQALISKGVHQAAKKQGIAMGTELYQSVQTQIQVHTVDLWELLVAAVKGFGTGAGEGLIMITLPLWIMHDAGAQWLPQDMPLAMSYPDPSQQWMDAYYDHGYGRTYYDDYYSGGDYYDDSVTYTYDDGGDAASYDPSYGGYEDDGYSGGHEGGSTSGSTSGGETGSTGGSSDQPTNIRGAEHTSDGTWLTSVGCFPPLSDPPGPAPKPEEDDDVVIVVTGGGTSEFQVDSYLWNTMDLIDQMTVPCSVNTMVPMAATLPNGLHAHLLPATDGGFIVVPVTVPDVPSINFIGHWSYEGVGAYYGF